MPVFQATWMYYLNHPALVLNGLALFYALSGSWLWLATQLRSQRASTSPASSPASEVPGVAPASQRVNRMFYAVGGVCLALALLLSLLSTRF